MTDFEREVRLVHATSAGDRHQPQIVAPQQIGNFADLPLPTYQPGRRYGHDDGGIGDRLAAHMKPTVP
ncbi:MAG: hypothetical protein H0U38_05580 [Chloroflexia bacterium]|nr:hypothetical protein [Chloroflexia bacterium]